MIGAPAIEGSASRARRGVGPVAPGAAALLLAGVAAAAMLADHWEAVIVLAAVLLAVCLRAPRARRRAYLVGTLGSAAGVLIVSPWVQSLGSHPLWTGPLVPVLGRLDITTEELSTAGILALRLAAVGLAFTVYALLIDHDRLISGARFARRGTLAIALATRMVPMLERDAAGLAEALRGRGVAVEGLRARVRLLSPLLAGSLERGLSLAESMEARGYGRPGGTRLPAPPWRALDRACFVLAPVLAVTGALWL